MIEHLDLAQILGPTCSVDKSKRRRLDAVSKDIVKAKKVIVVSGAGISCSSGIPDFRSENGLYSLVKKRYPDTFVTGKDLFSSGLFQNPATTSVFLTFIAELSLACQKAQPTRTHHFIQKLDKTGRLLRSYTQNVDGFERRMGMESGGRGKGLSKTLTRNVELHGDLGRVRCILCQTDYAAEEEYVEGYREGNMPDCPACEERCKERVNRGSRALAIGTLRPAIVLYDEPHPLGDSIGDLQTYDLKRSPDVMLIMGTSLKVHGLKQLVKSFAKKMHEGEGKKKGLVVLVNATKPGKEWEGIIDVHIQGETDRWVEKVEEEWRRIKPGDWEVQTRLDGPVLGKTAEEVKGTEGRPAAKGKVKSTTSYPILTAGQLPTPRPSLSPSRPGPSSSQSSSAPPTPCPDPETAADIFSPPSSPLSPPPASPSKRRAQVRTPIEQSPTKKPRAPASERGLLFGTPKEPLQVEEKEQDWEDEVFGSSKKGSRLAIVKKGIPAKVRQSTIRDKENAPIKVGVTKARASTKKLAEVVVDERKRVLRAGR